MQISRYLSKITWVELRTVAFKGKTNTEFGEMPFPMTIYATIGAAI